jgi:PAS domain S-box-containing protein
VTFRRQLGEAGSPLFLGSAVESLTGWPAEDFLDQRIRFTDIVHPDDAQAFWHQVNDALARSEPYTVEYRILHRDGGVRWVTERAWHLWRRWRAAVCRRRADGQHRAQDPQCRVRRHDECHQQRVGRGGV